MSTRLLGFLFLLACTGDGNDKDGKPGDSDTGASTGDDSTGGDSSEDSTGPDDTDSGGETGEPADHYDWSHCPGAEAWVGDESWTGLLEVQNGAKYCGTWNEERTLEQELAAKALFKLAPGSWPIPAEEGEYALALPACTLVGVDEPGPAVNGTGETSVSVNAWSGTGYTTLYGAQPLELDGSSWSYSHTLLLVGEEGATPDPLVVNGDLLNASGAGLSFGMAEEGVSPFDPVSITFGDCESDSWTVDLHHLEFDGGTVDLRVELGDNLAITALGAFSLASGTLDGEPFEVTEYFQLPYRPGRHHYNRNFAVIFDEPIGDVCALRIDDLDPYAEEPQAIVSTADCDLTAIETREVTVQTAELES